MVKSHSRLMWIAIALCTFKGSCKLQQLQTKHLHANYGDSVVLKCLNSSDDTAWDGPSSESFNIYKETPYVLHGKILQQLPNAKNLMVVGNNSVGEFNLKIINLTRNEVGFYKCNADRGKQLFQFRFFLNGTVPLITLSTNAKNGTLVGEVGDQMNITCRVRRDVSINETTIYMTMKHNDDEIIMESTNEVIIHSFVPERSNNGDIIKCVVNSPLLNVPLKEAAILEIKYPPSVRFDRNEKNLTVYEGTDFILTCFAESYPVTTEIFWKRNDQQIKQEVEHVGPHKSVLLHIVNIKRKNEGNYICVAKNEVGYNNQSIFIRVLCCQVKTEMKNTSVVVSISVITAVCIILGIIMFLTKDKLNKRLRHTSTSNSDVESDERDDIAVENQMYQSRDDIAEDGANPQSHLVISRQDYRIETSAGRVYQGRVDTQGNNALNYAEICFPSGSSDSRYVVHGRETITIYSDVVLPMAGTPVHSDS